MKYITIIILALGQLAQAFGQKNTTIISASSTKASTKAGNTFSKNEWTITPSLKPDIWEVTIPKGKKIKCSFFTDLDSISFMVEQGKNYDFIVVLNGKDSAHTRIAGKSEPVYFSPKYQKEFDNKIIAEIPKVHELTNILIALTEQGNNDSDLVDHTTNYYKEVINWFGKYKTDPVVFSIDSLIKKEWWKFFYIKMDSYAYEYKNTTIVKGVTYERLNFDAISNTLEPLIPQIQLFSNKTNFLDFYNTHYIFYKSQCGYYNDSINVRQMQKWLNKNFTSTHYNCYKIIFSPLTGGSQSANFFHNNNFSEAHAYINFPHSKNPSKTTTMPSTYLLNGDILFTELNHAYINPEANKYTQTPGFKSAFADLKAWEADNSAASKGYANAYACFNEYMNWALVSLYYNDYMPVNEQAFFISNMENTMKRDRGFIKFPEFNKMLLNLYKNRKNNETVADLYPEVIKWCLDHAK